MYKCRVCLFSLAGWGSVCSAWLALAKKERGSFAADRLAKLKHPPQLLFSATCSCNFKFKCSIISARRVFQAARQNRALSLRVYLGDAMAAISFSCGTGAVISLRFKFYALLFSCSRNRALGSFANYKCKSQVFPGAGLLWEFAWKCWLGPKIKLHCFFTHCFSIRSLDGWPLHPSNGTEDFLGWIPIAFQENSCRREIIIALPVGAPSAGDMLLGPRVISRKIC